jgi:hypothetical protein
MVDNDYKGFTPDYIDRLLHTIAESETQIANMYPQIEDEMPVAAEQME